MKRIGLFILSFFVFCLFLTPPLMANEGDRLWQAVVQYTWSAPVVIGDYAYLQDQEGGITCFNTSDGSQVWTTILASEYPMTSPTYRDGKLYVMAGAKLFQVDASTGIVSNTFTASGSLGCMAPAVTDSTVYVSTSSTLYAINISTFTSTWTKALSNAANVIVSDNNVIYALSDKLYALKATDGTEYWNVTPPQGDGFNMGTLSGGYIVAFSVKDSTAGTTQLHSYYLSSNLNTAPTLAWSQDMGTWYSDTSKPASNGTYVYGVSREGVLRCFKIDTGIVQWTRTVRDGGLASAIPAVVDGNVFIQDNDLAEATSSLVCLNATNGTLNWKSTMSDLQLSWGSPVIVDNVAYLSTDHGGGLIAFDAGTVNGNWNMVGDNSYLTAADSGVSPPPDPPSSALCPAVLNLLLGDN